ncbi:MAG TPA: DUF4410 domain-containing protein [Candidatus Methylomirabilis sp.]|nr:DUF4410 domain-containing protein [Candidatus Methylomirabilis sp.]
MNAFTRVAPYLFVLVVAAGCAKTTVTERQAYEGPALPRPDRILVYNFAPTASDLPPGFPAPVGFGEPSTPATLEQLEAGRQLGAQVAKELVAELQGMGLPAVAAAGQPPLRSNDIALVGYFTSVDKGSAAERMVVGFGKGAAELQTVVEAFRMTDRGLVRLGGGSLDSAGNKTPGAAVPAAIAIASGNPIGLIVSSAAKVEGEVSGRTTIEGAAKRTAKEIGAQLKVACQRQGWI